MSVGGLTGQGLVRATVAAIDLAKAQGISVRTAFDLVAKAATGYTSTLSRYGIILDSNIDESQKFEAALTAIESKFGGAAALALDTYTGRLEEFQGRVGDLREALGGPFKDAVKIVLENLSPLIKELGTGVADSDAFRKGVLRAAAGAVRFAATMVELGTAIVNAGLALTLFASTLPIVRGAFDGAVAGLKLLKANFETNDPVTSAFAENLRNAADELERLADQDAPKTIGEKVDESLGEGSKAQIALDALKEKLDAIEQELGITAERLTSVFDGESINLPDVEPIDPMSGPIPGLSDDELQAAVDFQREVTNARIDAEIELRRARGEETLELELERLENEREMAIEAAEEKGLAIEEVEAAFRDRRLAAIQESANTEAELDENLKRAKIANALQVASAVVQFAQAAFGENKALAYAEAIINTALAVTEALPNIPLAVAAGIAGAAQIATIAQTEPSKGFAFGGIVPGRVSSGSDSQLVSARPGEAILPPGLTSLLLAASGRRGMGDGGAVTLELEGSAWSAVAGELNTRVRRGSVRLDASNLRGARSTR